MKRTTFTLVAGASLAAMAGFAWAGDEPTHPTLQGITVQHQPMPYATEDRPLGDCTPPSVEPDLPACRAVALALRRNFTEHEIQMIFGAWSHSPEYLASYVHLSDRYHDFLRDWEPDNVNSLPLVQTSR
jgi:hypothetical protein